MKRKSFFRIRNTWQSVFAGVFIGLVSVAVIICLLGVVLVKFDIPTEYVKYLWFIPAVLSGLISGGFTGKYVKSKSFLWGSASAFAVSVICFMILLLVNSFAIDLVTPLILPVFSICGAIGGIVAANLK